MGLSGSGPTLSEAVSDGSNTGTYYGTGNPASPVGTGISGSGRGRLSRSVARSSSGRGPLSVQTQNGWANSRANRRDHRLSSPESTGDHPSKSDKGIISAAIANTAVLSSPPTGSENVSLLERQNTTPTKTQFTFTCESDSSKGMALQKQSSYALPQRQQQQYRSSASPLPTTAQSQQGFATQGTQTSPSMTAHAQQQQAQSTETGSTGRKKKRSPGSIYALAARERKIQQQCTNLHRPPPAAEDIWICEFCEYESIFGHPPEALIRQYEIKDRKERKRIAEKRRLLEKAKMKGRKGKKATKKNAAQHTGHHHHECCDRAAMEDSCYHHNHYPHYDDNDDNEDDNPDNEYDEEPVPISAPRPAPLPTSVKPPVPPGNDNIPRTAMNASRVNDIRDGGTSRPS